MGTESESRYYWGVSSMKESSYVGKYTRKMEEATRRNRLKRLCHDLQEDIAGFAAIESSIAIGT